MTPKPYAYLVTDARGSMEGRIAPGEFVFESEYKGNGSYTWTIWDFGKGDATGSFTGRYVGKVEAPDGVLTEADKAMLDRARSKAT